MRRHLLPILFTAVFSAVVYIPALNNGFGEEFEAALRLKPDFILATRP